mgnify:CR=1 FL=1
MRRSAMSAHRTLVQGAAKVRSEPSLTDATRSINDPILNKVAVQHVQGLIRLQTH